MKKWTTTSWMYQTFGSKTETRRSDSKRWKNGIWETTDYHVNYDQLQNTLNELTNYCNQHQMSVKAIVPLTAGKTYEYGTAIDYSVMSAIAAAGIGHGWGISNIVGFAALLERVEEISDEEYERRCERNVPNGASPPIAPGRQPAEAI